MPEALIRFQDFELDLGAYELRHNARVVKLERMPIHELELNTFQPQPACVATPTAPVAVCQS